MMLRRFVESLACIVTATIVPAVLHPAHAQITGATVTASPPSYAGNCPTTISFSGVITGKPGTTFWATFAWLAGKEFSGDFVETMPTSGSLSVQYSISVPGSTTDSMQVWVRRHPIPTTATSNGRPRPSSPQGRSRST
ncbi:MAG TPA: hypothetical protein VLY46_11400 [Usitatibacter sp.]|nr:hypothetical protein [Usitatibacter sp.]